MWSRRANPSSRGWHRRAQRRGDGDHVPRGADQLGRQHRDAAGTGAENLVLTMAVDVLGAGRRHPALQEGCPDPRQAGPIQSGRPTAPSGPVGARPGVEQAEYGDRRESHGDACRAPPAGP